MMSKLKRNKVARSSSSNVLLLHICHAVMLVICMVSYKMECRLNLRGGCDGISVGLILQLFDHLWSDIDLQIHCTGLIVEKVICSVPFSVWM